MLKASFSSFMIRVLFQNIALLCSVVGEHRCV